MTDVIIQSQAFFCLHKEQTEDKCSIRDGCVADQSMPDLRCLGTFKGFQLERVKIYKIIAITLILRLLVSNLILYQNTNTRSIPEGQIPEVYKGLKQNEYLKVRLQKTEVALTSANQLINEQDKALSISKSLLTAKDEAMGTVLEISKQDKIAAEERENQLNIDISYLKTGIDLVKKEAEVKQRKRFWNGFKIGAFSLSVLGVTGLILLNNK